MSDRTGESALECGNERGRGTTDAADAEMMSNSFPRGTRPDQAGASVTSNASEMEERPAQEAERRSSSGQAAPERAKARRSVVIVDDDPVLVESLRELLHEEGYAVEGFTDARVALGRLQAGETPDLVLLDYLMPGMTGEEFIEAVDAAGLELRILLFTAMHESAFQPASSRIAGVIRKPFDLDPLLETLDRLSGKREAA